MGEPSILRAFLPEGWRAQPFAPFRDGVEICLLREDAPQLALLRYEPGAAVPRHSHPGLEMIQVLDGSQSDERGTYVAGDIVMNPPGSVHSVWSEAGCVVLILWERPVEFLAD